MKYIEICPNICKEEVETSYDDEFFEEYNMKDWVSWDTESGYIMVYDDKPYLKKLRVKSGKFYL
nr:MAG TPA: hypothetical protein [Caudoviricetes sp.]